MERQVTDRLVDLAGRLLTSTAPRACATAALALYILWRCFGWWTAAWIAGAGAAEYLWCWAVGR